MSEKEDRENLYYMLGEINAKMDVVISRGDEDRKTIARLAHRLEKLERWKWIMLGSAAGAGGVTGYIGQNLFI